MDLELEKLMQKIAVEIEERIIDLDFKVKSITFDKKDNEVLKKIKYFLKLLMKK